MPSDRHDDIDIDTEDDPDETADLPRAHAQAMGILPADDEPATRMAAPGELNRLQREASSEAVEEDGSIVSFVSNVSVVTQSVEAPSPLGGPMPADVEPSTMGSITLEPRSSAAEPITIEPRMGVRGMMPGGQRSPIASDADDTTGARGRLVIEEDVTTATVPRAELLRTVANEVQAEMRAAAAEPRSAPRPAAKGAQGFPKRSKTVIGLAPDPQIGQATGARVGTQPLVGPATEPMPTAPMRDRSNSEDALIARAMAFAPVSVGMEDQPAPTLAIPPAQNQSAAGAPNMATMLSAPLTPPSLQTPLPSAAPSNPSSSPALAVASPSGSSPSLPAPTGSSPGFGGAADGPTPAGLALDAPARKQSRAPIVVMVVLASLSLLATGGVLGWKLRTTQLAGVASPAQGAAATAAAATTATATTAASTAETSAAAADTAASAASATPDKGSDVEPKNEPEPEKTVDLELKDPPTTAKPEHGKPKPKPRHYTWKPAPKPAAAKPSAKPPAPTGPKPVATSFDPGGI